MSLEPDGRTKRTSLMLSPDPVDIAASSSPGEKHVFWSRRRFLTIAGASMAAAAGTSLVTGWYAHDIELYQLKMPPMNAQIVGLDRSCDGLKLAHLTDLHASEIVPMDYLKKTIDAVAAWSPDVVAITGDLVTHGLDWLDPLLDLLKVFRCPVLVTLGNHDYGFYSSVGWGRPGQADALTRRAEQAGLIVLRNQAYRMTGRSTGKNNPQGLWFVGMDDLWANRFDPDRAFAQVPLGEPAIVLSHNPDTAEYLDDGRGQWILSGHTHGGQVRLPLIGAPILPVRHRQWDQGVFPLKHARLLVNRGVGFIRRIRFNCPPQVILMTLRSA